MSEVDRRPSSQGTPRSNRDNYLKSYSSLQKIVNGGNRLYNSGTLRRSQSTVQMRVVDNNRRGRNVDRITEAQMRGGPNEIKSIYQHDYPPKSTSRERDNLQSARAFSERKNSANYRSHSDLRRSIDQSIDYNPRGEQSPTPRLNTEDVPASELNETQSNMRVTTMPDELTEQKKPKIFRMQYTAKWEPFFKIPQKASKLGIDYNGIRESLYRKDFKGQMKEINETIRKNDFYATFHNRETIDLRSTMRSDFKNWNQGPPKRVGPKRGLDHQIPLATRSNYKTNYVDWRSYSANIEKAYQPMTIVQGQQIGNNTLYKESFAVPSKKKAVSEIKTQKPKEGVFSQVAPFLGETSYQQAFKGFRVAKTQDNVKPKEEYRPNISYSGSFRTTFGKDFKHPKENTYWPGENEEEDEYLAQSFVG